MAPLRLVGEETGREHLRNAAQILHNVLDGLVPHADVPEMLTAVIQRAMRAAEEWQRGNW